VPKSILEAIKSGEWDYEPNSVAGEHFDHTEAMPGSKAKVSVMADRIRKGHPLWHPKDREELKEMPAHIVEYDGRKKPR
jgi:hypothetical protein